MRKYSNQNLVKYPATFTIIRKLVYQYFIDLFYQMMIIITLVKGRGVLYE